MKVSGEHTLFGVISRDPSATGPDYNLVGDHHTWLMSTSGIVYYGGSFTDNVAPRTKLRKWDMVAVGWCPPQVSVYHNNTLVYHWDVETSKPVWMVGLLPAGMILEIHKGTCTCEYYNVYNQFRLVAM